MWRRGYWTALALLVLLCGSASGAPMVYDFEADYATVTMGPVWRYRAVNGSGTLTDMVWGSPFGLPGWQRAGDGVMGIFTLSNVLFLHPGLGDLPVAQFVSPTSGWYDVSVTVYDANGSEGDGVWASLSQRASANASPFGSQLAAGLVEVTAGHQLGYTDSLFLNAGSVLNLVIDPRSNPNADATRLEMTATFTHTPEPTTGLLVALGLIGLVRSVRRRRR